MVESRTMNYRNLLRNIFRLCLVFLAAFVLLGSSSLPPGNQVERARAYTRQIEFDYISWTLDAIGTKLVHAALGTNAYLPADAHSQALDDYLDLTTQIKGAEAELNAIFADPEIENPNIASASLRKNLDDLYAQREQIAPVAEEVLQMRISAIVADLGLTLAGQSIPPVLYHSTPLPDALIISPREVIRQDADISLSPELTLEDHIQLEENIDTSLNVSSLVVPIGGIGLYPTMVQETTSLNWLSEVVSHEWVHNFLTTRPLGLNYLTSQELRVMNETAASIAGKEIRNAVLETFYPELVPPETPQSPVPGKAPPNPPEFDFRVEMHETRLTVDQMLADGKIDEAELYMEMRRTFFWENGYRIRKLNQAYFAFYGAYADQPGGAAGATEDPVGQAVRTLRRQSPSLAAFLNRISWMTSFEQLLGALESGT
jgi:hypothetical protein